MRTDPNRVIVGMSGGVDSSVAAGILVEQGYACIGITIKTYRYEDVGGNVGNDSSCCSLDGINDARRICMQLGIPHYTVDFSETFRANVIDYFIDDYMAGNTPNPCVRCNRTIKWREMLRKADSLGAEYIATGHYAMIMHDEQSGRRWIRRSPDAAKDQSYMLWSVEQELLGRTMFPLAGFTKPESRSEAERLGLDIAAKGESYEICFIPDNDYRRFLRDNVDDINDRVGSGPIILDGKVIGTHEGYPFYTVGQRKGLGVSHAEPLYVLNVLPQENAVVVGTEEKLYHRRLTAGDVNLQKYANLREPRQLMVKIRYKDAGCMATCHTDEDGTLHVEFAEPRPAITKGQSVVLYEGDDVVGGGIITASLDE
ncbi:MAG: tRNA 2-thiouridine(34) synthase MnmA [Candidatus Kapabacteria bacterium]|nr:tRNA 2-thiouridine(34) synthase MnmA [Candidatus Kapabacteria bacterium]